MLSSPLMPKVFASACLAVALFFAQAARAQAVDIDKLVYFLQKSDDFRVRTQTALALGASKAQSAVDPLCGALEDSNTTVRAAAAAALGRLNLGGGECLEQHFASESSEAVKSAIQKALEPVFTP